MPQYYHLNDSFQRANFNQEVDNMRAAGRRVRVQIVNEKRTPSQNDMINALYGDIAKQAEDLSVVDVRRYCKLHFGVPILRAYSEDFRGYWNKAILHTMDYEGKLYLMDYMPITSRDEFTVAMGTEYIDNIMREYSKQGYHFEAVA